MKRNLQLTFLEATMHIIQQFLHNLNLLHMFVRKHSPQDDFIFTTPRLLVIDYNLQKVLFPDLITTGGFVQLILSRPVYIILL